eukprot:TRINITY_DN67110_c9_g4_i1.p1 TRINITY_DN67110_c9_g4~~TRINITY_DN67110_c9_g4_i1.p1  ORF type:complete len:142 (-),score=18.88 TRINITY_DN67110_c9_g4_i1:140-565(-)
MGCSKCEKMWLEPHDFGHGWYPVLWKLAICGFLSLATITFTFLWDELLDNIFDIAEWLSRFREKQAFYQLLYTRGKNASLWAARWWAFLAMLWLLQIPEPWNLWVYALGVMALLWRNIHFWSITVQCWRDSRAAHLTKKTL